MDPYASDLLFGMVCQQGSADIDKTTDKRQRTRFRFPASSFCDAKEKKKTSSTARSPSRNAVWQVVDVVHHFQRHREKQ